MGRQILKKDNVWSLISTVSDNVIFTTDNIHELAKFIATDQIYIAKIKAIETLICFPGGEWVNGVFVKADPAASESFYKWQSSLYNKSITNWNEYWDIIDNKLEELILKDLEE